MFTITETPFGPHIFCFYETGPLSVVQWPGTHNLPMPVAVFCELSMQIWYHFGNPVLRMSLVLLLEAVSPENNESALLPLVRKEQNSVSRVLGYPDALPRSGKQRCLTHSETDRRIQQAKPSFTEDYGWKVFGEVVMLSLSKHISLGSSNGQPLK